MVLGLTVSIIASIFLLINFLVAVSSKIPWLATIPESLVGQPISLDNRVMKKLGIIANLIIAVFFGIVAASSWQDALKFNNSSSFGVADPVFGRDIAFYIFSLPVFNIGLGLIRTLILFSLIGCGAVYMLRGNLNISGLLGKLGRSELGKLGLPVLKEGKHKETSPSARIHIGILLFLTISKISKIIQVLLESAWFFV